MANARAVALSVLKKVFENGSYSVQAVDGKLRESDLDKRDKAFVTNMVYGVLTNLKYLDFQIASYSSVGIKKISQNVLDILRISIYQIKFMDKVPESAAVNEGVKLAKKVAFRSSGFVNGVLRTFLREGEKLPDAKDDLQYLSVKYSFPEYMVSMWLERFGREKCEKFLSALNEVPKVTVRVNLRKTSIEDFIEETGGREGICPCSVILPPMGSVSEIKGFSEGHFIVQDGAAQLTSLTLAPKEGDKVLDMCAAPGGKTTHLAELVGDGGEVIAWDIYEHKIALIEENAARLSLSNIKAYVHNGKDKEENLKEYFDAVLLDAPCSGLGIIKKKPEIKWQRKKEDIGEIIKEQKALIESAAHYIKRGGAMVYSTCTVNEDENEKIVLEFLANHPDFSLDGEFINVFPCEGADGFFIARIVRSK